MIQLPKRDVFFYRLLQVAVGYLLASRAILAVIMVSRRGFDWSDLFFTVGWGLSPYVGLLLLARMIGSRIVLVAALLLVALTEAFCWMDALSPGTSTAGLGVFLQPICAVVFVIPGALLMGWIARRLIGRRRAIRSQGKTKVKKTFDR